MLNRSGCDYVKILNISGEQDRVAQTASVPAESFVDVLQYK